MIEYLRLTARGFLIVALVAANTRQIVLYHRAPAFVFGFCVSAVWWFNSRSAARSEAPFAWVAYALGAGFGTITGMWIGSISW